MSIDIHIYNKYIPILFYSFTDFIVIITVKFQYQGPPVDRLRHVEKWTVNQEICRNRYVESYYTITENMLCSGYLDVGGRDACSGDSGGPLLHNNAVVGITSFGENCAHDYYPGVNVRISNYISWIQNNV